MASRAARAAQTRRTTAEFIFVPFSFIVLIKEYSIFSNLFVYKETKMYICTRIFYNEMQYNVKKGILKVFKPFFLYKFYLSVEVFKHTYSCHGNIWREMARSCFGVR